MDNFGFIHGELDTKILILYVLRRLPAPEGCVWATVADLADTRPLPGAFKAWRRVMETEKLPAGTL